MKYVGTVVIDSTHTVELPGKFKTKDQVIDALIKYSDDHISYCLDTREDRIQALKNRNFCICGCGPSKLIINEIN